MKLQKSTSQRLLTARTRNAKYIARLKSRQQKLIMRWLRKEFHGQLKDILRDMYEYRQSDPYHFDLTRIFSQEDWLRERQEQIVSEAQSLIDDHYKIRSVLRIEDSSVNNGYLVSIVFYPFMDPGQEISSD